MTNKERFLALVSKDAPMYSRRKPGFYKINKNRVAEYREGRWFFQDLEESEKFINIEL